MCVCVCVFVCVCVCVYIYIYIYIYQLLNWLRCVFCQNWKESHLAVFSHSFRYISSSAVDMKHTHKPCVCVCVCGCVCVRARGAVDGSYIIVLGAFVLCKKSVSKRWSQLSLLFCAHCIAFCRCESFFIAHSQDTEAAATEREWRFLVRKKKSLERRNALILFLFFFLLI